MELTLVMPVYNEEEIIPNVIESWVSELNKLGIEYEICAYNDGSKDQTLARLKELGKLHSCLKVIDKKNSGHGSTILLGYRTSKSEWIFQVDSDNEMKSENFKNIWEKREKYDFLIGARHDRVSPISRRLISFVSRLTVNIFYGIGIKDVNSPFRLYKREKFCDIFNQLPEDTFAPNVILTGYSLLKGFKVFETPIPSQIRQTGEVSIKNMKLIKAAIKSWKQTVTFRFKIK